MSDNQSIQSDARRLVRRWTIGLKICLVLVVVPPLIGFAGTVLAMMRAFDTLGPQGKKSDPSAMAEAIGEALMATATGIAVSFPALIFLIISIIGRVRAKRRLAPYEQAQASRVSQGKSSQEVE